MQVKQLMNGDIELQDEHGGIMRLGPQHPDYRTHSRSIRIAPRTGRLFGAGSVPVGVALTWTSWHEIATSGTFYPHIIFGAILCLIFGALTLVKPEYAGPARDDADKRSRMLVTLPLMVLAVAATGMIWYLLSK
jgi:hypothetical protein